MITLNKAKEALLASETKAKELGIAVTTVIVDEHGSIIAVSRMDTAIPISPEIALSKAYTSANLGAPTATLLENSQPGKPYFGVQEILGGKMTILPGGLPVLKDGKIIGAAGVGGSMDLAQDVLCAETAVKTLS
ncbi:heme-binding protein [Patescibacteria group bacterium]|nr:heme-binding protein [Patescibacteria group bacterium]